MNERNPIDALLDPNDTDPVVFYDDMGNAASFEQICLVPIGRQIFTILKPMGKVPGIGEDEALVFQIYTDKEREDKLLLITDREIIDKVFKVYDKLFDEQNGGQQ